MSVHAVGRLVVVAVTSGSPDKRDWLNGVEMSVDEASRSAALFGGTIQLRTVADPSSLDQSPDAALTMLVGGSSLDDARAASAAAAQINGVYMNACCRADAFHEDCAPHVFHTAPADRALKGARQNPGTMASPAVDVRTWHASLTRFGADTLNKRFVGRYGSPMTAEAWQAWCGVKAAWEATLRSRATNSRELIAYLERKSSRFDAHKGDALFFDGRHELVQTFYMITGSGSTESVTGETTSPIASSACSAGSR